MIRAEDVGGIVSGIDVGKNGSIALRSVFPWSRQGELIGYLVLGEYLGHLLGHLDEIYSLKHAVLIDQGYLDRRSLAIDIDRRQPALAEVVERAGHRLLSNTLDELPSALLPLIEGHQLNGPRDDRVTGEAGRYHFRGLIELKDLQGERIGGILTLRDVSALYLTLNQRLYVIYGFLVLLGVALLAFLYRTVSHAESLSLDSFEQIRRARDEWDHSFDAIGDLIFIHDAQFRIVRANRAYARQAGMDVREVIGKPYWEVFPRLDGPFPDCQHALTGIANGRVREEQSEETIELVDGDAWVSRSFSILDREQRHKLSIHILENVTGREVLLASLQRENRARKVISKVNRTVVGATDQQGLLQTICDTITNEGKYPISWVGFCQDTEHEGLDVVCSSGIGKEELDIISRSPGMLSSAAIAAGEVRVSRNLEDDLDYPGSREIALHYDYDAGAAFPLQENGQTFGVLFIGAVGRHAFDRDEVELLREVALDMAFGILSLRGQDARTRAEASHRRVMAQLERSLNKTVTAIASAVETRDPYTAGHQRHVAELAVAIATELGLDFERVESIRIASTIHDVGKIYIPAEILSKPTRLTPIEYEMTKSHSQVGYDIIRDIDFPWRVADMVLQHHERLDGSGDPNGLKGEEILLESRIISVADVFEAMSSHRPYRAGLGIDAALGELERGKGSAYDPAVVDACIRLFREQGMTLDTFFK